MTHITKCINGLKSKFAVVLGAQWGDQGKGKLVDIIADRYDICARFNGGANAGHTVVRNGHKYAFHLLPCGLLSTKTINLIGNGVVLHPQTLFKQLSQLDSTKINYQGRLLISDRAHLVTNYQLAEDQKNQKKQNLGTTKRGIGPTYAAKINRFGLRVGDLINWNTFTQKYAKMASYYPSHNINSQLTSLRILRDKMVQKNMIIDSVEWINKQILNGKTVLAEGANAGLLDIDFGTYPYVTSSSTSVGGVCTGLGVPPQRIQTTIGVVKAYTTRVGQGPFPTELQNQIGEHLRKKGHQFGTTTGRPRRCGWLDLPIVKYTNLFNGYSSINITKLDILDELDEILLGVEYKIDGKIVDIFPSRLQDLEKAEVIYEKLPGWKVDTTRVRRREDLPQNAIRYLQKIQKYTGLKVSWVGTGPSNDAMFQF